MKVVKGIFLYLGIVIAAILSLVVVVALMMFFVPSFRFFGLGLLNENIKSEEKTIVIADYTQDFLNKIDFIVSTKSFNVEINYVEPKEAKEGEPPINNNVITYYYYSNVLGFTTDKISTRVYKSIDVKDGVMTVSITQAEPSGFLYFVDSKVVINVPIQTTDSSMYSYGVIANSKSGHITINGIKEKNQPLNENENPDDDVEEDKAKYFNLRYLNVTTGTGSLFLNYVGNNEESLSLSSLVIFTENGNFDFSKIPVINVVDTVQITATKSYITFAKLKASVNVQGQDIEFTATEIETDDEGFEINAYAGKITIDKLVTSKAGAENIFISNNCEINLNDVKGKTGINAGDAKVNIVTMRDTAIIKTDAGDVTVKYMFGDLIDVISDSGNIVVDEYKKNGIFESNTGAICVYSTSTYTKGIKTRITTNSGKVRALIKANHLVLTTTGEADVRVAFQDVNEFNSLSDSFEHTVTIAGKSRAKVYMPTLKEGTNDRVKYKFMATGVITGSILGLTDVVTGSANVSHYEDYQYYPSTDSVDNSLLLSTFKFTGGHIEFEGYASWTFSPNGFFNL